MHAMVWFWTTGIHDPAWIQATASIVLAGLTSITLVVLCLYAWDTHTLAKTSAEQISLMKTERDSLARRNYHVAYDRFLVVQADITAMMQSLVDCTFGTSRPEPVYPENWPDVTNALFARAPKTASPAINLGIKLRHVDFAVREFFATDDRNEKIAREAKVKKALIEANEQAKALLAVMERPSE